MSQLVHTISAVIVNFQDEDSGTTNSFAKVHFDIRSIRQSAYFSIN
jgi:hypothetical protein